VTDDVVPGEVRTGEGTVTINEGRETATVSVANTGDRPVQVGSHFHFFEANAALEFDREAAFGMRLNIPAGTAVRFEPGDEKTVDLVALGGNHIAHGMNGLVNGLVNGSTDGDAAAAVERAEQRGFGGIPSQAGTLDDGGEGPTARRRTRPLRPTTRRRVSDDPRRRPGDLRGAVRPDCGRQGPPGRHRACSSRSRETCGRPATKQCSAAGRRSGTVWDSRRARPRRRVPSTGC